MQKHILILGFIALNSFIFFNWAMQEKQTGKEQGAQEEPVRVVAK